MTPSDALVLGLDQGSHASRAVLFDAAGTVVAQAHVPVATRRADDRVEQDAEELVRSLRTAMQDACDAAPARGRPVAAAGLATQRSTIVAWDPRDGRALTPAISWQDRRNAAWLAQFAPAAARIRAITGLPLSPHYGASKMRWCLDHLPELARAAEAGELALGPLSSYLTSRLLADRPCVADPANASRTLLYDVSALDWSDELLALFALPRRLLPRCVPTCCAFGELDVGGRRVPLTACTGDQAAAAFADGRPNPSRALVNVGTGAFVQRAAPAGAVLPDGVLRSVLRADATVTLQSHEGTVNGAGSALDWLREHTGIDVDRAVTTLSSAAPDAWDPPLFMNGVGGLGAPFWVADFPTEFVGAGADDARVAAVVESIAFLLCINLEALRGSAPLTAVRISGGLARSDYLCRCLASVSGLPVERYEVAEATARGVALLAAGEPDSWRTVSVERAFPPEGSPALAARFARWRSAMARRLEKGMLRFSVSGTGWRPLL